MPTPWLSPHDEWRHGMKKALNKSEEYSSFSGKSPYRSWENEPFSKNHGLKQNATKSSMPYAAPRRSYDEPCLREQRYDENITTKSLISSTASRRKYCEPVLRDQGYGINRFQQKKKQHVSSSSSSSTYICTTTSTSTTAINSNSRPKKCLKPKLSKAKWCDIEKRSQREQKEFLEQYFKDGKFKDVSVDSFAKNIRRGDHILYQGGTGGLYDHHLLCTEVVGDDIHTIEYTGPSVGLSAISQSVASSNVLAFGAIKRGKLTYKQLEKKKAKIREWPEELKRYSVNEVISRAESRRGERDYHAFNNNCEHFVTWCICGLNTSLQVKPWYQPVWDTAMGAYKAAKKYAYSKGGLALLRATGNVSDELLGAISSPLSPVGFALGAAIETGFAAYDIHKDWKRMKEGRLSRDQFKINSVNTASKAVGRTSGMIAGSIIGSAFGPVGSILGGVVGYGVGHVAGKAVGLCYEYAPKIKNVVKNVVKTTCEGVKAVGRKVYGGLKKAWNGVKSFFSSLFS